MGDPTSLASLKVGDSAYFYAGHRGASRDVTVTKIGRKWITTNFDWLGKFDITTGSCDRYSNGRLFTVAGWEAYQAEQSAKTAAVTCERSLRQQHGLGIEGLHHLTAEQTTRIVDFILEVTGKTLEARSDG